MYENDPENMPVTVFYPLKKKTSLHDRLVFDTLYPPANKLFL